MEKVDLTNYERQIDQLVDEAIDCVASKFVDACGQDPQQISDYNKVYHQIQDYLVEKWTKEKRERLMAQKLAKVDSTVEGYLNDPYYKDNGCIAFTSWEEASKANTILKSKGFETDNFCDEGYEQVKYWRPGNPPQVESIC